MAEGIEYYYLIAGKTGFKSNYSVLQWIWFVNWIRFYHDHTSILIDAVYCCYCHIFFTRILGMKEVWFSNSQIFLLVLKTLIKKIKKKSLDLWPEICGIF